MNYVVAVLPDRIQAEGAYLALEAEGIKSTILGRGYKTADEFGLVDPKEQAKKQAKLMSYWLIPFGFFCRLCFQSGYRFKYLCLGWGNWESHRWGTAGRWWWRYG